MKCPLLVDSADHRSFDSLNHSPDRVVSDSGSSKNEETLNVGRA